MKNVSFMLVTLALAAALPSCSDSEVGSPPSHPSNGSGGSQTGSGDKLAGSSSPGTSGDVSGTGAVAREARVLAAGGSGVAGSEEHDADCGGDGRSLGRWQFGCRRGAVPSRAAESPHAEGWSPHDPDREHDAYLLPQGPEQLRQQQALSTDPRVPLAWLGGGPSRCPGPGLSGRETLLRPHGVAQGSTIFIAPDGIGQGWGQGAADLTFTDDILKQVEGNLCIDKSRIFSTGFIFGAAMSYALACARPGMLRAIVLYAGGVVSGCMGGSIGTPIPYLETHGTDDGVFPISPVTQNNGGPGKAIRNAMVKVNGCTAQDPSPPADGPTNARTTLDARPATRCAGANTMARAATGRRPMTKASRPRGFLRKPGSSSRSTEGAG